MISVISFAKAIEVTLFAFEDIEICSKVYGETIIVRGDDQMT